MDFSQIDEGHTDGEEAMVFRYNRAERIARAPKIVQDYYAGKLNATKRGLFKSLVATRANRFLFFSVILCAAALMFLWYFGPRKDRNTFHAVPAELTAFSYMDTVYTAVTLGEATAKYAETEPIAVSAAFSFVNVDGQLVHTEKIDAKYDGNEKKLATTLTDYDIMEVSVALRIADEDGVLSAKVSHR